jgi:ketosteroid isomerase-like protein
MSRENVELVRRLAGHWSRMDWDGMVEFLDPDVELHGTVGGVEEGGITRGLSEILREFDKVEEMWDDHRIEIEKLIDAGDQVVVFQREYQRGKTSGAEVVADTAVLVDVRDDRVVRLQGFMDRSDALEAAGLER